ncbi:MAG: hypothetical protein AAF642_13395, partial [Pseudomonadota bacterium]
AFLSSLADRECIAFGSAISTPMRMRFRNLAASARPSSQNVTDGEDIEAAASASLTEIVTSLRGTKSDIPSDSEGDDWIVMDQESSSSVAAPTPDEAQDTNLKRRSLLRRKTG